MDFNMLFNLLLLYSLSQEIKSQSAEACKPNEHNLNGLRCCKKCAPGRGVLQPCNKHNDTVCGPCRKGEMFSSALSHQESCQFCTICPQYSHVKRHCNETHDTECECDINYFWDDSTRSCQQCDLCPMGFGAKRKCDLRKNTVCSQCPQGTYSDVITDDACKVCSSCDMNQLMLRYCDSMHDTLCVDMPSPPPNFAAETSTAVHSIVEAQDVHTTHDKLIPVYCGVLGLVILAMIIYVIVKHVQYKRNPPNSKNNVSYTAVTDPTNPQGEGKNIEASNALQIISGHKTPGSECSVQQMNNNMRAKQIAAMKLKRMEEMLHSCNEHRGGWTSFARELGYSNAQLASFESKAQQLGRLPAAVLIADWCDNQYSTVAVLVASLSAIDRQDIITMLYTTDVSNNPQPVNNAIYTTSDEHAQNQPFKQYDVYSNQQRSLPSRGYYNTPHTTLKDNAAQLQTENSVHQNSYNLPNYKGHRHVGSNSLSGSSTTDASGMHQRSNMPNNHVVPTHPLMNGQQII